MMKLKSIIKYNLNEFRKSAIIMYSILVAIMVILLAVAQQVTVGSVDYGGNELSVFIFAFVLGIALFKEPFCLFIQNGVSRKSIFFGQFLSFLAASLIMAILDKALLWLGWIFRLFDSRFQIRGFFEQLYDVRYDGAGNIQMGIEGFLFNFCFYAAFAAFGYFIGALYCRMNKGLKIAVSVGVPVLLFVVLPVIDSLLAKPFIYESIFSFIRYALGFKNGANPYYAITSSLLAFALFNAMSWLLMRKSSIKG